MGLLQGPVEPGQGRRVVSYWTLNDMMNDTVLTSGYAEDLGDVRLDVWEQRRGWARRRRKSKPIAGTRGLWVGLQVSVEHMRYMCLRTYTEESLPGSLCGPADPGQGR